MKTPRLFFIAVLISLPIFSRAQIMPQFPCMPEPRDARLADAPIMGVMIENEGSLNGTGMKRSYLGPESTKVEKSSATARARFRNPVYRHSLPDPYIYREEVDGRVSYWTCMAGATGISISRSDRLSEIKHPKRIWNAPADGWNRKNVWAPELFHINDENGDWWYIYYAAGNPGPDGGYGTQRAGVLRARDPMGPYEDMGMMYTGDNYIPGIKATVDNTIYAIDMTTFVLDGQRYAVWSGNVSEKDGNQRLYIATMENPWTISSSRVEISRADQPWELENRQINEGPAMLFNPDSTKLFIVYSCNGSWTDKYRLGWLEMDLTDASGRDPMKASNWSKSPDQVFYRADRTKKSSGVPGINGVGHNTFTKSPDGKEDWNVYHVLKYADGGWGQRFAFIQKFIWDSDGRPVFGTPVSWGAELEAPSGENLLPAPLDVKFGDPYVLLASDGYYYMYGTGGVKDGFGCYRSENLKDWEYQGAVYQGNTPDSWAVANFWAPEVYERDGKFYMFFSADWRENPGRELENFHIGVAVSDSPTGPFREISDKPLFSAGYPAIDGNVLFDKDGRCHLYFSRCCYKHPVESEVAQWARKRGLFDEIEESWIYGVELKPDFSGIIGDPVLLLSPPSKMSDGQAEWESRSVTSGEVNRRWTEGSFIIECDGIYYMMYSANFFGGENYAVGYATSKSPLGPFVKSEDNPVLEKDTPRGGVVTGVGHNSITRSRDGKRLYCVYHGRTAATGNDRMVFISEMEIRDGKLRILEGGK